MNIEVTAVPKKEQKMSRAAAAFYVITQEDNRRSWAASVRAQVRSYVQLDGRLGWRLSPAPLERGLSEPARQPAPGVRSWCERRQPNPDAAQCLRQSEVAILIHAGRAGQGRGWQRLAGAAGHLLLAALLAAAAGLPEKSQKPTEYELKAAFLYTFAQFTEWPPEAFADPSTPLVFGIAGADPFGSILEETVKRELVHGRPVVVRRFTRGEDLRSCHVLFVSASERRQLPQILADLKGASVLTVSEIDRFRYFGGIVTFIMEGPKVRFEINLKAAENARLKISSKLLKLAKTSGGGL